MQIREHARRRLLSRGFALEYATLGWNVTGIVVLASGTGEDRQHRAIRLIGAAFVTLGFYLLI